jgi:hypothetical protein
VSSSVEAIILADDVASGDVIVLPDARDAVLVKQVRLGQGGFILTVVPVADDRPGMERLVTLTAGTRLRKTSR